MHWKSITELQEPFNDAINYRNNNDKNFFNKIFFITEHLKRTLHPSVYFLMGEKGSGKTAYAVYLENNATDGFRCKLTGVPETQYRRFVELKKAGKLNYSDYSSIWRSMLLFMISQVIVEKCKGFFTSFTGKFAEIEHLVSEWNQDALNPEVECAFEALYGDGASFKIGKDKYITLNIEDKQQFTDKTTTLKHHILETETNLKQAISSLKLGHNLVLFIDGIDYRPESVAYIEYLECIKGLGEAIWQLNTEFFNRIKDSKGRIKIVGLVRPDVFHTLNLYNSNSRIQDNCVFLNWSTTESEYATSLLYAASGKFLSSQQSFKIEHKDAWNHYFPARSEGGFFFKHFLKHSFQKPRDILTAIKMLRAILVNRQDHSTSQFDGSILKDPIFTRDYSDYLLGEVRNYAAFYMTQDDFSNYLKFFQYLNGKSRFDWADFQKAFEQFKNWVSGENIKARDYLRDPEALLQLFYDVNIVGYQEFAESDGEPFWHWSYRERSINNIAPKVKIEVKFMLNPGISKALDIGKSFAAKEPSQKVRVAKRTKRKKRPAKV